MSLAVVIPAAGSSSRFGSTRNKLVQPLCGQSVISRTLAAFLSRGDVQQIIIVAGDDSDVAQQTDATWLKEVADPRAQRVAGGASRAHSVLQGIQAVRSDIEWVAVHDAARPLISQGLIDATLALARQHGAAVPAMPVALTIKRAAGQLPAQVERTVPRHDLYSMQTPQVARRQAYLNAFANCPIPLDQVTDDMQLIELAGQPVWLTPGEERNLKITTQLDLSLAELLMRNSL
jgi:2-C-methyl-D-erythritol 4-phosphate cytidylyltransferase